MGDTTRGPESELERLHRRLNDSTLQTLEYIAAGGKVGQSADVEELMRLAAREATELRECLEALVGDQATELGETLRRVITQERCFAHHEVQLVAGPTDGSVGGLAGVELAAAVREALTNLRRHAWANRVTVYFEEEDGGALVTVKDDGTGAELLPLEPRLTMRESLYARMARLGGGADLRAAPERGLVVTLRVPGSERDRMTAS